MLLTRFRFNISPSRLRILAFLVPIFFFYFNENIISLTYPLVAEKIVNSALIVGSIISLSTIASIICDFLFPQILKVSNWKQQFVIGMILAILLNTTLYNAVIYSDITLLVLAAVLWSVYYEFCAFAVNNYLAISEKGNNFVLDWSLITIVYNIASIIGPILASYIIDDFFVVLLIFQLFALLSVSFVGIINREHEPATSQSKFKQTINLLKELEIWKTLIPKVLPLLLFSISIGIIDSVYWTIGGLFAEELFATKEKAWLPIVMYSAPFILGGIIMARLNLKKRKKFISQLFLILASLVLLFFFYPYLDATQAMLLILISSFFLALAEPLNDASYSNLLQRLGKNMEHLVGIKKVSYSIAYLIGPILAGYLSTVIGFRHAIGLVGLLILMITIFLLMVTPKKIRIPQQELAKID